MQLSLLNKLIFFLLFFLLISCTDRQKVTGPLDKENNYYTEISGEISGQLTVSNSPYLVIDDVIIEYSHSLNIYPGVIIHFTDSSNFLIKGKLTARGAKDKFIQFSSQNDSWKGIKFIDSNQNSVIQFAIIEKVVLSYQDSTEFGAIEISNSSVTIKNCIIRDNEAPNGAGIAVLGSEVVIDNNIIRENHALVHGGGLLLYQANSNITNNTFYNNFCTNCGAGIALLAPVNDIIRNNIFFNNFSQTGCSQYYFNIQDSLNYLLSYNFISLNSPNANFISEENLRLAYNSPCINNGDPDLVYNDADGTRNDQGAFGGPGGDW